jgi:hypothetical protein
MSADPDDRCRCIAYEADEETEACVCGHAIEEHRPTREYPGDTSCKAAESEGTDE